MTRLARVLLTGTCAVVMTVAAALSAVTPAVARYSNTTHIAVQYGKTEIKTSDNTLSPYTMMYDFGCWYSGVDESSFTHTIRLTDTVPLVGRLRFSWDDYTYSLQDVVVSLAPPPAAASVMTVEETPEVSEETPEQESPEETPEQEPTETPEEVVPAERYVEYAVSAADGVVELPFSLTFTDPAVGRLAALDVSWYPENSEEPALFARYLLALLSNDAQGTAVPTFVSENTKFLTDSLLQVAVTTPAEYPGVCLSVEGSDFVAGTRYYTPTYPEGISLLRDSALYIDCIGESTEILVDTSVYLEVYGLDPMVLFVGVSDTLRSSETHTPPTDTPHLTVAVGNDAALVSAEPLTITLTEPVTFRDSDWTAMGGTAIDLSWSIAQRVGETMVPVTTGETITVTPAQTETGGTLTIAVPDGKQPAGTYLLTITQYYKGYAVVEMPIWFFIDYR